MNLSALVFDIDIDIGDQVTGWDEIRNDDDGVWFDPPHCYTLAGRPLETSGECPTGRSVLAGLLSAGGSSCRQDRLKFDATVLAMTPSVNA